MEIEKRYISGPDLIGFRNDEGEEGKPTFYGYGAVFNSLSEPMFGFREVIEPGFFDDVLNDDVRALIDHNPSLILGRTKSGTLTISVDEKGLYYEAKSPGTSFANDLAISMQRGDVTQSSFAFSLTGDGEYWEEDEEGRVIRHLTKAKKLYDVSPVTYPAYPEASSGKRGMEEFLNSKKKQIPERYYRELKLRILALK